MLYGVPGSTAEIVSLGGEAFTVGNLKFCKPLLLLRRDDKSDCVSRKSSYGSWIIPSEPVDKSLVVLCKLDISSLSPFKVNDPTECSCLVFIQVHFLCTLIGTRNGFQRGEGY